ncbi:hypothetical protein FZI91_12860 [Mycobacterium sp. CBMA271]|uniref:hemophore-related protein n=1 Tax=unclassified Mycobacteroides TaxID=2618759 RepID=UPI0012DC9307|nr:MULTISPECIES: heme-binding protein [unclassified Mycobacteroides]MUM18621.1 hypothetical protein [Mycobacteroides sp. CBMA 326]MUM22584.1 hypothetical protein [Mycobacteroides sp. CBMA 271]
MPEPVMAPAPVVSAPVVSAPVVSAPVPEASAPAAAASQPAPQAQTPQQPASHDAGPAESPKPGNALGPASPEPPASATAPATPAPTTAAPDQPKTPTPGGPNNPAAPTTPSATPTHVVPTPAPAPAGTEPGRHGATKPDQPATDDSAQYAHHRWPYSWHWKRDLAWNDTYAYDWANSGYWDNWYPTWTNTCAYRCPTNDNGPYAPDVQNYLDAHPDLADEFARVHQFPWELRRAQIQPFLDAHPDYQAWFNDVQPWI